MYRWCLSPSVSLAKHASTSFPLSSYCVWWLMCILPAQYVVTGSWASLDQNPSARAHSHTCSDSYDPNKWSSFLNGHTCIITGNWDQLAETQTEHTTKCIWNWHILAKWFESRVKCKLWTIFATAVVFGPHRLWFNGAPLYWYSFHLAYHFYFGLRGHRKCKYYW